MQALYQKQQYVFEQLLPSFPSLGGGAARSLWNEGGCLWVSGSLGFVWKGDVS